MRWLCRRGWLFPGCLALLVPLSYGGSFLVFETSEARSCTGGLSGTGGQLPTDGLTLLEYLGDRLTVGPDAFFSFRVRARSAAIETPLDRVTIRVTNQAGELVPGTARVLDDQRHDQPQLADLLLGWEASKPQAPGELTASVVLKTNIGSETWSGALLVTDEESPLPEPAFELRDWAHGLRDTGEQISCGMPNPCGTPYTFGSQLTDFAQMTLASLTPAPAVAVAWKYTLEPSAGAAADWRPERFFVQGPSPGPIEELLSSSTRLQDETCLHIQARDLRTDLEYSTELCGAPSDPPQVHDKISNCNFENLPADAAYQERWCRAHPDTTQAECQSILFPGSGPPPSGTAGRASTAGSAGNPAASSPGGNGNTAAEPTAERNTSQACALTRAPAPGARATSAAWALALLLAARARRRRASSSTHSDS